MRVLKSLLTAGAAWLLLACGGGGGGSTPPAPTYTVSGSIAGLLPGTAVVLADNGANATTFTTNGTHTYTGAIATGTAYAITVQTQPVGETCTVANGAGTVGGANISDVAVTCAPNRYTISGTVGGVSNGTSVVLRDNGGNSTTVTGNAPFAFSVPVASGANYNVSVATPPAGEGCTVANGQGTVGAANVTNVQVTCFPNQFSVGVAVTGLPYGASLVLQNAGNGGTSSLTVNANGPGNLFPAQPIGTSYSISVSTQPAPGNCVVTNPTGTMGAANVANVAVDCPHFLYVANNGSSNVSLYSINNTTGVLTEQTALGSPFATAATNPYGIAMSPNLAYVYVPASASTGLLGYLSDPTTAALTSINSTAFVTGNQPFNVVFNAAGTFAFTADFAGGTVSSLSADPANGVLTPVSTSIASGLHPYGVAVAPQASFVYVANSDDQKVSAFAFDGSGTIAGQIAGSPFFVGDIDPFIAIDPTGHFAYVTGAQTASIIPFTIDQTTGALSAPGTSATTPTANPSGIAIHPNGQYLYVSSPGGGTSYIAAYAITPITGALTPIGSALPTGNGAGAIVIDPTAQFVYVANQTDNTISAFTIDPASGVPAPISTPAIPAGTTPDAMVVR